MTTEQDKIHKEFLDYLGNQTIRHYDPTLFISPETYMDTKKRSRIERLYSFNSSKKHNLVDWGRDNLRCLTCTTCDEQISYNEDDVDDKLLQEFLSKHS